MSRLKSTTKRRGGGGGGGGASLFRCDKNLAYVNSKNLSRRPSCSMEYFGYVYRIKINHWAACLSVIKRKINQIDIIVDAN